MLEKEDQTFSEGVSDYSEQTEDFLKNLSEGKGKRKRVYLDKRLNHMKRAPHQPKKSPRKPKTLKQRGYKVIRKADFNMTVTIHAKKKVDPKEIQ